ncbi:MAG: hypothetical protein R2911_44105 [Caldilineaceae bacterium]
MRPAATAAIEILLLQAVTHAAQQQREPAIALLTQALRLAEPENYVRLFVDEGEAMQLLTEWTQSAIANGQLTSYVDQLLAAFAQPTGPQSESGNELLI